MLYVSGFSYIFNILIVWPLTDVLSAAWVTKGVTIWKTRHYGRSTFFKIVKISLPAITWDGRSKPESPDSYSTLQDTLCKVVIFFSGGYSYSVGVNLYRWNMFHVGENRFWSAKPSWGANPVKSTNVAEEFRILMPDCAHETNTWQLQTTWIGSKKWQKELYKVFQLNISAVVCVKRIVCLSLPIYPTKLWVK